MKPNNTAQIIGRKSSVLTACLIAIACLLLLAANFSYTAFAQARVIRVAAADIAKLSARQNYVVDLRKGNVTYDLDGTTRAIDWNRVRIRTAAGEVALNAYLREHSPARANSTPTRLVIGAKGGVHKVLGFKAAQNPGTEYECGPKSKICSCSGGIDCENLLLSNKCKGTAVCGVEDGAMYCDCASK
jgi:hypothetical protein